MRVTRIEAARDRSFPDVVEAWRYRGLLLAFARRNLAVRYRQAAIGVAWIVLQPLIAVTLFTFVFRRVADLPTDGMPYSAFAAIGMTAWLYFARVVADGSNSLVANQAMLTKVWFPRILLPMSHLLECLVDYSIMLALAGLILLWHGVLPDGRLAFFPAFFLLLAATAAGVVLWASALNVRYRDVRAAIPFLLQTGLFVSMVVVAPQVLTERQQMIVALNPAAVAIDGLRWCLGGAGDLLSPASLSLAAASALATLISGAWYFARAERRFADVV
jgi:lipopolysaccharide transport system permease protein